ncbi:MAG: alpha/beta fold hydrolase, partial [Anaerolineales bacterium]
MNANRLLGALLSMLLCWGLAACTQGSAITETYTDTPRPPSYPAILPDPGAPGTLQPSACRFALPEDLIQGEGVDCYYLTVEEQREGGVPDTSGRVIRLAVAVFHPPGGASQPDPVIYLSGGPGVSILEMVRWQYEDMSEPVFAGGRDLILLDQRGVGLSIPALDCPRYDELVLDFLDRRVSEQPVDDQQMSRLLLESLGECRDDLSNKSDLTAYNSAASAADVEDLRKAMGYQQINLWGGSYGTRLALEVMRRYPLSLRSVVLDAVYPPDADLYLEAPANFSRALERLFEACAENAVCSASYPDLRQVYFDTVINLTASPVLREIQNPMTGEKYEAWLDGSTFLGLTFQLLYDSRLRYLLPQQIYAASQGDYHDFDLMRGVLIALLDYSYRGMMFSVQCHEELAFSSMEQFRSLNSEFPELAQMYNNVVLGELAYRVCQECGAGVAEADANQPVRSRIPTLLMGGEFDPITPPEWGKHAAETLENGYFFEYPGIGHGASVTDKCPMHMM